eukprot:8191439-Pyramimonas_sp.AAC.1
MRYFLIRSRLAIRARQLHSGGVLFGSAQRPRPSPRCQAHGVSRKLGLLDGRLMGRPSLWSACFLSAAAGERARGESGQSGQRRD